ncbi:MAG: hypothetical protein QHJ73_10995 [Armatimonadota bacterium]|nr:hypothetical protein [Armatimonadota bacterium]
MEQPDAVRFPCPNCGAVVTVHAVQGDRCPGCAWEVTFFRAHEEYLARDFHARVTGPKHLVHLPDGRGWASVHP